MSSGKLCIACPASRDLLRSAPMKRPVLLSLIVVLAACAAPEASRAPAASAGGDASPSASSTQLTQAATTPLSDLNLVHADIPHVLAAAQRNPYLLPLDPTCPGLSAEVQALDSALGPDLDAPASPTNPGLVERGAGAVGNVAVGAVRGAAEGVVPFRGWVRKLSGAERYSKQVAAAIAAGSIRRAFLKGLGQAAACPAPATPLR